MRIGTALCVDRLDIRRVHGEFDTEPIGARQIKGSAIAVIGNPVSQAMRFHALQQFVKARGGDFERDVPPASTGREDGAGALITLAIGKLEERECAAIGQTEERMAIINFTLEIPMKGLLAPGRDQWKAQNIREELTIDFLILHHESVVMEPERQLGELLRLRACIGLIEHGLLRSRKPKRE